MLTLPDHPLAAELLTVLRDRRTAPTEFRQITERLGYRGPPWGRIGAQRLIVDLLEDFVRGRTVLDRIASRW